MFTLKLLLKRSCWTFIFMALALPVSARVCFLPDSTDCGEGGVNMPDVQVKVTCATYGGYETPEACLAALKDETAQTCILNSGCYYPKCAYDSERNCKRENPNKNCLSKNVEGVKCWYSKLKTCSEQGYKTACSNDENSTEVDVEASGGPCYICTPKKNCNQLPGKYYGPKDTCPQYHDREDADISAKDGKCSVCKPQDCTTICKAIGETCNNKQNKDTCSLGYIAKIVDGTNDAADGPCYTCELGTVDIVKPVITITYKETYHSLEPSTSDPDRDKYYYKTLKFTATSSDTINRTIQMKTYPSRTCGLEHQTSSPVTINEGVETTYSSSCGVSSVELLTTSTAALDTFINGTKVYRFTPSISNPREDFAQLDGKTVEAQGYTLKFVKGSSSTDPNEGKTYYVLLERNVEAIAKYYIGDSNIEANDTSNVGGLTCKFSVRGKIKYPDVSGDTFMNKVYFGAKIAGYIDFKENGFGYDDDYSEKSYSWPVQNLMSDVNNRTIDTTWGASIKTSPLPCEYKDLYSAYSSLNASYFWVGFNGAKLYNDANKLDDSQRCKTLTKNGSSRTICVKYDDEQQQYDCSHWGLISEDNYCSYSGEQFKCTISPDATHPEDDFKHKCGKQNSAAFSFSSKHCPVWSDSGSSKCSYYPEGYAAKPGFKTENRLLNNYIILWLNNDDKIEFAVEDYGNRRLVPAKQEYVVMATIKSSEMVNEFGNRIDDLRQFYQLFIDQTLNNKTCFMYMNPFVSSVVDVSENTWNEYEKSISGSSRRCTRLLKGQETSYSGTGYLTSSTATSSVGKWFNGKTIDDFVDKEKWKKMISSGGGYYAYIWYRITPSMKLTKTNTVEEFTVYPGCTRDVAAPMSQCFYGWAEHGAQASNRCSRFCPDLSNVYMFK